MGNEVPFPEGVLHRVGSLDKWRRCYSDTYPGYHESLQVGSEPFRKVTSFRGIQEFGWGSHFEVHLAIRSRDALGKHARNRNIAPVNTDKRMFICTSFDIYKFYVDNVVINVIQKNKSARARRRAQMIRTLEFSAIHIPKGGTI